MGLAPRNPCRSRRTCSLSGSVARRRATADAFSRRKAMATATITQEQIRSAISEGNRRFMDAIARQNADAAGELYTNDAHVLPADAPMVEGKTGAREFWASAIQQLGLRRATLETIDVEASSDLAVEIGRFTL